MADASDIRNPEGSQGRAGGGGVLFPSTKQDSSPHPGLNMV